MITQENIKDVTSLLTRKEIEQAIEEQGDYISLELHTSNTGSFATVESSWYDEAKEYDVQSNGNVYTDKDTFLSLLDELTSI